jgi:catechol 2,3-dioxygenase-like lactoylglutathione lyase family enzyme
MTAALNHTIVPATDKAASSEFLARILSVPPPKPWGPFLVLALDNGVSLDFEDAHEVHAHHYAFLVDEAEFDPILERIKDAGVAFFADPFRQEPGRINHLYGGRGVYFDDPDSHYMEVITQPYGAVPEVSPPGSDR